MTIPFFGPIDESVNPDNRGDVTKLDLPKDPTSLEKLLTKTERTASAVKNK